MASNALSGPARARLRVWDLPLRLFHWLLVAAIALALVSAEEESALNDWHILSGWVAGLLVAFRLVWGFVGGEHSRFMTFVKPSALAGHLRELLHGRPEPTMGHNALGALSVLLLLAMVATTVWTGVILAEDVHELLGWSLLALVVIHILAVVVMSLLTRENLVRAMVDGTKPADRHPSAGDARAPGPIAYLAAGLAIAAGAWAVTRFDPRAFTLRSAESYEHQSERGAATEGAEDHDNED
ncbi:cytochrome b/b6 domain-containing protein [Sphingosinicella sp. YJ22]|uniref:cytochrome b/b6 domain-containing protein n=1 Tax=Sphingosinicella sp. YJ22 TaxID=1104780 RepID=UPI00140B3345|nr:cytochrome b/b6 domain-containing protein [Sphingosinicella sp. YJ22]